MAKVPSILKMFNVGRKSWKSCVQLAKSHAPRPQIKRSARLCNANLLANDFQGPTPVL